MAAHENDLVEFRRDLRRKPELSGQEHETTAKVFRRLRDAGLTPRLIPGGNGLICELGTGGRVVALRADLDALPLPDAADVPYRSTVAGVSHACGHDVHTAMLLGAGLALAEIADRLPGRVRLVFQPSEEKTTGTPPLPGARRMIDAGAIDGVDEVFAVHCHPGRVVGKLDVSPGPVTATGARLDVDFIGPGGHSARPGETINPVEVLSEIALKAPSWLLRRVRAATALRLLRGGRPVAALRRWWGTGDTLIGFNVASVGSAENVLAATGTLVGTMRSYNETAAVVVAALLDRSVWAVLTRRTKRRIAALRASGAAVELSTRYTERMPMVTNDDRATTVLAAGAVAALGAGNVGPTYRSLGGEDFGYYLKRVPGAMARIGTARPGEAGHRDLHQGDFDVDESVIGHGVAVLVHTAWESLSRRDPPRTLSD